MEGDEIPHQILPFLYLGSKHSRTENSTIPSDRQILHDLGITHIVDLSNLELKQAPNLTYLSVNITDTPDIKIISYFDEIFPFIQNVRDNNQKVLVHCNQGISRSSTVIMGYLMTYEQYTLKQAFQHTKQIRRVVLPNTGFITQLIELEMRLHPNWVEGSLKLGKYNQYLWQEPVSLQGPDECT